MRKHTFNKKIYNVVKTANDRLMKDYNIKVDEGKGTDYIYIDAVIFNVIEDRHRLVLKFAVDGVEYQRKLLADKKEMNNADKMYAYILGFYKAFSEGVVIVQNADADAADE